MSVARPLTIGAVRSAGLRTALSSVQQRLAGQGIATNPEACLSREMDQLWPALLEGSIDLGVSSIADWPVHLPFGVTLAAVCQRLDPLDVLLTRPPETLATLRPGSSLYAYRTVRSAQFRRYRPDLILVPEAGPPGLAVLQDSADAFIFPGRAAGRLDRGAWNIERLEPGVLLPPPLEGIFVVAMREAELKRLPSLRETLHDHRTAASAAAEAGFRSALAADEIAPLAALATWSDEGTGSAGWMDLSVRILSPDGTQLLEGVTSERVDGEQYGRDLGAALALDLVGQGALDLLDLSRSENS